MNEITIENERKRIPKKKIRKTPLGLFPPANTEDLNIVPLTHAPIRYFVKKILGSGRNCSN